MENINKQDAILKQFNITELEDRFEMKTWKFEPTPPYNPFPDPEMF